MIIMLIIATATSATTSTTTITTTTTTTTTTAHAAHRFSSPVEFRRHYDEALLCCPPDLISKLLFSSNPQFRYMPGSFFVNDYMFTYSKSAHTACFHQFF